MVAAAAGLLLVLSGPACTATNFLDPEGPRYYENAESAKRRGEAEQPAGALRIVSFNVAYGREVDAAIALLRSSDALRDADILLLQEMAGAGVVRIAAALGVNYLYYPSGIHPQAHQEFGTAILSRWPIVDPAKLVLPHGAAFTGLRRAVTAATVQWRDSPIRVYSVHLPSPMAIATEDRQHQVQIIVDDARRHTGPVIVAGDFNSRSVGDWFEREGFTWVTRAMPGTSRGPGFWLSFDHVFASRVGEAGGVWSAGYVDTKGISDHRAVWARLDPPPAGPAPLSFMDLPPRAGSMQHTATALREFYGYLYCRLINGS
jgi:endonuclease/exonuclease/phosphatase family metal-dependent hydrolase